MKIASNGFATTWLFILTLVVATAVQARGLSTSLGEVVVENLQVGQIYSLKQLANLRLSVANNSDDSVALRMDVLLPDSSELKKGSRPIPDVLWLKLSQNTFALGPNEIALSDITLSIPDENRYLGKKYQVTIWSHTVALAGRALSLGLGLKSRIIFTTDTVRAPANEIVKSSDASVELALQPEKMFLDDIEPGKTYDPEARKGSVLTVSNHSGHEQLLRLRGLTVSNSATTLTKGYEDAPDASFLRFSEDEFVLPPFGTKEVKVFLDFPQRTEYCGKRFMFVIHAFVAGEKVSAGVYSRVYASIK
ncbi:MAG: hypothetical protein NT028_08365 [candidate division Zixibacteria bacterium]|nr:hypothetical protein [candidate division Zixibacteria bacterium]